MTAKTYKEQKKINKQKKEVLKKVLDEDLYKDLCGFLRGKLYVNQSYFLDVEVHNFNITRHMENIYTSHNTHKDSIYTYTEIDIQGILSEFTINNEN